MLINWLKENNVIYDKLIFTGDYYTGEDKLKLCIDHKLDIMIEDNVVNVNSISDIMPVICFDTSYNQECIGKNIIRCYSWYDIYIAINKIFKQL